MAKQGYPLEKSSDTEDFFLRDPNANQLLYGGGLYKKDGQQNDVEIEGNRKDNNTNGDRK